MKVALIMFYDDAIKSYGDINYNINKLYCKKHNLEIIVSHKRKYNNTSRCINWVNSKLIFLYNLWFGFNFF